MRSLLSKKASLWTCFACALLLPACQNGNNFCLFGYSTAPNYRTDIHTVRVKIFENSSFRPGLEFELTRAVIRQIEQNTPYKVVQAGCPADTEITGKIVSFGKGILNVNNVNEERDIETTMAVEFSWKDLRSGQFLSKPPPGRSRRLRRRLLPSAQWDHNRSPAFPAFRHRRSLRPPSYPVSLPAALPASSSSRRRRTMSPRLANRSPWPSKTTSTEWLCKFGN